MFDEWMLGVFSTPGLDSGAGFPMLDASRAVRLSVKVLQRYLLRQILATLLMTAAVFTFVLLLGNLLREVLPLVINQKATFKLMAQAFGLLIPFVAVFALPMGMLTATLLVFGRFSADQELTAARASGLSLISLITPVIILSLALCGLSALVNLEVGPRSRVAYNALRSNIRAAIATLQLPEQSYIPLKVAPRDSQGTEADKEDWTIYVGRNRRGDLHDVLLYQVKNETNLVQKVHAPTGRLEIDSGREELSITLSNATVIRVASGIPATLSHITIDIPLETARIASRKPGISDMTLSELRAELKRVERQTALPLSMETGTGEETAERRRELRKQLADVTEPIRLQIHRRISFSFACFGFTLIGITLGIRMHRRETNVGIAVALLLVAVYYGLVLLIQSWESRPELAPHLLIWLPNFLFQAVGAVLLWRANKGV